MSFSRLIHRVIAPGFCGAFLPPSVFIPVRGDLDVKHLLEKLAVLVLDVFDGLDDDIEFDIGAFDRDLGDALF